MSLKIISYLHSPLALMYGMRELAQKYYLPKKVVAGIRETERLKGLIEGGRYTLFCQGKKILAGVLR